MADLASSASERGDPRASLGMIVFLRCPKPGQVKTRLAKTVGDERACCIYEACAEGVLRGLAQLVERLGTARLYVFFSVAEEATDVERWVGRCVDAGEGAGDSGRSWITYHPQRQTGCLGERMVDAFSFVEAQGHARIGIVGTDVPDLADESVVLAGLRALGEAEERDNADGREERVAAKGTQCIKAVLGPSIDGGFYMLLVSGVGNGFFGAHGDLFQGIVWSTETVMVETSRALKRAGVDVIDGNYVPRLRDLDEWEDVSAWMEERGPGYGQQARLVTLIRRVKESVVDTCR